MNPILWQPSPDRAASTQIMALARKRGFEGPDAIQRLWQWSVDNPAAFWREVEARFPAWRAERDYFHAEGRRLKATLRHLLGS